MPVTSIVSNLNANFAKGLALFVQHEYTSNIPLNDANSVYADRYNLLQAKVSWRSRWIKKVPITLFAGMDNIFDETYSLGNDINAFGQHYFNAAMRRNYYVGIKLN